jgi:type I restriction enzyme M protein
MAAKRKALETLKRDELLTAIDRFELPVTDRRVRDNLVEVLARSRRAGLAEILEDLPRTRLKEICRALNLDDSGREKAVLISRIAGEAPAAAVPPSPPPSPIPASPSPPGSPKTKLTREALERYLWSAADILRGSIDSSDYKNYILGLLFLKRLSDRFEEESEIVRAEGSDPEDPDEHQFFERARWPKLQKLATGIGEELNRAAYALEGRNSALEGVLAGIDFNDERKLGDTRQRDTILSARQGGGLHQSCVYGL